MKYLNLNNSIASIRSKKVALCFSIAGLITAISFPVFAQIKYPPYALFQPLAYSGYPYRSNNSDIASTLTKETRFKNLVDQLEQAELLGELKQKNKYTLFAPNDEAFDALEESVFDRLENKQDLLKVLKYHLVVGEVTPKQVDSGKITTSQGNQIQVTKQDNGEILLNGANAKQPPLTANNGVIIEIDKVLLPPDF
jgi:uncharacterized surface protein with fasciclin (FAS1) repeats